MKFKNPQHRTLYKDAITLIKANKFNAAIGELKTLKVLLKESRVTKGIALVDNLIQSLKIDPKQVLMLIQKQEAKKCKSRINDLENKANELYNGNDFENAASVYEEIATIANNNNEFAFNYADACWSQGACYESIAAKIRITDPKEALKYIEKAIKAVKISLAAYIAVHADEDINVCTQKLKSLREYLSSWAAPKSADFQLSLTLHLNMKIHASPRADTTSSLDLLANATEIASTPMYTKSGFKKWILERFNTEKSITAGNEDNSRACKPA